MSYLAWGLGALAVLVVGFVLLRTTPRNGLAQGQPPMFINWNNPSLALVVSGQTNGYLQPCGCSDPQLGGLARRYNFLDSLRRKWSHVVAVELGDVVPNRNLPNGHSITPEQAADKYIYAMKSLKEMDYAAVGLGLREFKMPVMDALSNYSLNNPQPRPLVLNLQDPRGLFAQMNVRGSEIVANRFSPRLGILGVVGPSVGNQIHDPSVKFDKNGEVLEKGLLDLAQKKAEAAVILYQGYIEEAKLCASHCENLYQKNRTLPQVHVILCLSREEEPPSVPDVVGTTVKTHIVRIGHKGRYVGVVGFFPRPGTWDIKYQLVAMDPSYAKRLTIRANPIERLMEKYAQTVKDQNYLVKGTRNEHPMRYQLARQFPANPNLHNSRFVGSERCADCHDHAYKVWKKSHHSHAYDTLVHKAKNPSNRQYDPECIVCHTVGYGYKTGYADPGNQARQNLNLVHVGCESCHGPASIHANNPNNTDIHKLINPYKGFAQSKKLTLELDRSCQKCHDLENDVHWKGVETKWKFIEHNTPKR